MGQEYNLRHCGAREKLFALRFAHMDGGQGWAHIAHSADFSGRGQFAAEIKKNANARKRERQMRQDVRFRVCARWRKSV